MAKLKLGAIVDDKPFKVAVDLPERVPRDLVAYADLLAHEAGQPTSDPAKSVVPMLARFMTSDRTFAEMQRKAQPVQGRNGVRSAV